MMYAYEKYGIEVGQRWYPASGAKGSVLVVGVEEFKECGDVVIYCEIERNTRRIDAFKLSYRYSKD